MEATHISSDLAQTNPLGQPRLVGQAEEIASTSPGNECALCGGTRWIRVQVGQSWKLRKCECLKIRMTHDRLAEIPERFRESTFENYRPKNSQQEKVHSLMREDPGGSFFLHGPCDCGKTHLLHAQYRTLVLAGLACNVRTTVDLLSEIQRMEFDQDFLSPVFAQVRTRSRYHLYWDDADKVKITDFRAQALHELIDLIYRNCLSLTITSNFSLKELGELEKLPPSVIRRIDAMCKVLEV